MEVKIDKFGRILIPKKIREELGLKAGQRLELSCVSDTDNIYLAAADVATPDDIEVTDFGLPVLHNGKNEEGEFDNAAFMKETREAYLDKKNGLECIVTSTPPFYFLPW